MNRVQYLPHDVVDDIDEVYQLAIVVVPYFHYPFLSKRTKHPIHLKA